MNDEPHVEKMLHPSRENKLSGLLFEIAPHLNSRQMLSMKGDSSRRSGYIISRLRANEISRRRPSSVKVVCSTVVLGLLLCALIGPKREFGRPDHARSDSLTQHDEGMVWSGPRG